MDDTERRIEEIRARTAAATKGPWVEADYLDDRFGGNRTGMVRVSPGDYTTDVIAHMESDDHGDNADFIAHARDDVPWLLAELDKAREALKAAVAYDKAIQACANEPEKMASFCTAQGEDLDQLYERWISSSCAALGVPRFVDG